MKPVRAKAKRHTVILRPLSSGRTDIVFTVQAADGGPVSGKVEERRRGMFGHKSQFHDLHAEHQFRTGAMSQGYRLAVIPDQDVEIGFLTSHWQVLDILRPVGFFFGGMFVLSVLAQMLGLSSGPS